MKKFNPEKELKKIQHGNKNKIIISVIALLLVIAIGSSYALYQVRYSKRIIYTKVGDFSKDLKLSVYVDGVKQSSLPNKNSNIKYLGLICDNQNAVSVWNYDEWNLELSTITLPNKCDVYFTTEAQNYITEFNYTGEEALFTAPQNGIYRFEAWGAQGGDVDEYYGGKGAYTSGEIILKAGDKIYVYVGAKGNTFNGGGFGSVPVYGNTGGGATDFRLTNGSWDDFDSLKSRIMVAGGGGSANNRNHTINPSNIYLFGAGDGGSAGGLTGYSGRVVGFKATGISSYGYAYGRGGTQTSGGLVINFTGDSAEPSTSKVSGLFGAGGSCQSGGGGGYYGGGCSSHGASGGGSSFISGHQGCDAISSASTDSSIQHTESPNHYSNKVFTNTTMIDGEGYKWTTEKTIQVGVPPQPNSDGNGYARITLIKKS